MGVIKYISKTILILLIFVTTASFHNVASAEDMDQYYRDKANKSVKKFAAMIKGCTSIKDKGEYSKCVAGVARDWLKEYSRYYDDVPFPLITGNDLAKDFLNGVPPK
jgi:hypothetical protein